MIPRVIAVARSRQHRFSKATQLQIRLVAGLGVEGDAHAGTTVKHRSRVRANPDQPNLRQVHLIHGELFSALTLAGFRVSPGDLGENITTSQLPLLELPEGTLLQLGASAVLRLTGLRNPCLQLDRFAPGLMQAVLERGGDGTLIRKCGVMAVVLESGDVAPGDPIRVVLPPRPHRALAVV